jgi:tRNASer (uridine44-2'-O)-methyltransferase
VNWCSFRKIPNPPSNSIINDPMSSLPSSVFPPSSPSNASFQPSNLSSAEQWLSLPLPSTSKRYPATYNTSTFWEITLLLLQNPQFNSSHLFRADVLFDSAGELSTHGVAGSGTGGGEGEEEGAYDGEVKEARVFGGFSLQRTVVRRLVPRNPRLDRAIVQTGHFYRSVESKESEGGDEGASGGSRGYDCVGFGRHGDEEHAERDNGTGGGCEGRCLAVYTPHVKAEEEMPWYHPSVQALAFLYEWVSTTTDSISSETSSRDLSSHSPRDGTGSLFLHILPFSSQNLVPTRIHRTALALLATFHRIASSPNLPQKPLSNPSTSNFPNQNEPDPIQLALNPPKDALISRHRLQDTYTALKLRHATGLIEKWVEKTEPSKHVFEDLGIAAFLIEVWRDMYGAVPRFETEQEEEGREGRNSSERTFPGFVDVACGNGVLVHLLLEEGYEGYGFDARRRKTWAAIFPDSTQARLQEKVCIPKPFLEALLTGGKSIRGSFDLDIPNELIHDGTFSPETFIISNHADELTTWTPILAVLSQPEKPLPFLAIPCCSHALSGVRNRYKIPKLGEPGTGTATRIEARYKNDAEDDPSSGEKGMNGPETGDLKAMRVEKQKSGGSSSAYAALTAHTAWVALELGYKIDSTLLRIPSTRNVGVVGRRMESNDERKLGKEAKGRAIVEKECGEKGNCGVREAAMVWIERIKGLRKGQGRGKVNLHCKRNGHAEFEHDGHHRKIHID